ncbi:membrane protein insertion efficiency factor YidD [Scytonema sp. NUACC21]
MEIGHRELGIVNKKLLCPVPQSMQISVFHSLSRQISVAAITGYQKHISPRKGFSCAYRILYGRESCSQYIKQAIATEGLRAAIVKSRSRFQACSKANQILLSHTQNSDSTEETPNKKRRTSFCSRNRDRQWDCSSSNYEGCEGSCDCASGLGELATSDCGIVDCGSLDCSAADCGSLDFGSCCS